MQTVLIVVHLFIVLALIVTVLLQRSEGGLGLGGGGSSGGGVSGFMTGRGQANALTRATAILAALFFATSISLAIVAHHTAAPRSILDDGTAQPGQTEKQPANADNLLDTLRQQGGKPADGTPAPQSPAPAAQVPPAPAAPVETAPAAPAPATPEAPQSR
ncbi:MULTISPECIES: preprotein translocase subunit SecG [Methylobacterium]|uniref:Protein-export membrane protein SecG n=1 Tax=Methylobacterium thuringiense TaxID=1003091 RepID=A0ABQ4TN83_9HYPH|nr:MULTISPECIES: preprotein translocase subunit SecG [Methylobacterium]TXN23299.1 preprotein translocase subunit SecG [Methylobacterium sp. WL9]GJE56774.1 hypothetical protein EKPJFOCH_3282 [Methylobacterium thuringiense]